MRVFLFALLLVLGGCQTTQVTTACEDTNALVSNPLVVLAPPDVQLAVTALKIGSYVCGTPEYAAARERVKAWLNK